MTTTYCTCYSLARNPSALAVGGDPAVWHGFPPPPVATDAFDLGRFLKQEDV